MALDFRGSRDELTRLILTGTMRDLDFMVNCSSKVSSIGAGSFFAGFSKTSLRVLLKSSFATCTGDVACLMALPYGLFFFISVITF